MGVPVAQKSDSWVAEIGMADCGGDGVGESCGLGVRPINGGRGGEAEQRGTGQDGPPVSPPERACTPPTSRMGGWRRFSSPGPVRCLTPRSVGYEDGEDSERYFSPQSEISQDTSDTDSMSTSISRAYTFRLGTSSPLDSPMKQLGGETSPHSRRSVHSGQYSPCYPWNSGRVSDDVDSSFMNSPPRDDEQNNDAVQQIDFESNQHIWYPPPPQDEGDDFENGFFEYDEDDDNEVCDGKVFGHVNLDHCDDDLGIRGKHNIAHKEFLRNSLHGHFRALVSQLLQGHGIDPVDGWSDIVSSLAWQAATFVRPDTNDGGSMDPTDYIKVKCVATGNPDDSTFIKGVVCTKNVKHKRMVSKHENPRLLILGGALEHQKVTNKLASINSIIEQEKEYLKNAVAKIEAQRPHVLLVEKSVPLYAQQLLAKEISLVLNVLLRGRSYEELKKIKLAVQFAVFAAYHLSLETSYLADEGATLPKVPSDLQLEKQSLSSSYSQQNLNEFQTVDKKASGNGCIMPCLDGSSANQSHSRADFIREDYMQSHSRTDSSREEYIGGTVDVYPHSTKALISNGCIPHLDIAVQKSRSLLIRTPTEVYISDNVHRDETPTMVRVESDLDNGWHHISDEERAAMHDHNEYFPTSDNPQSILVSLSIACPLRGIVCKQSQLFRIKFYGTFDKPLGRYFHEDLFVQTSCCESCKEPAESHVRCYTHQQGSLTISVKTLASIKLPGERDEKIWMWHRLGSMVAVFRYSPVDILSVNLPSSVLDFAYPITQDWVIKEASDLASKKERLYMEIIDKLDYIEKIVQDQNVSMTSGLYKHIVDLKDLVKIEWKKYDLLSEFSNTGDLQALETIIDVLELNRLRQEVVLDVHIWDRRLYMMHSLTKENCHIVPTDAHCSEKLTGSFTEELKDEVSSKHEDIESSPEQGQSSTLVVAMDSGKPSTKDQENMSVTHLVLKTDTVHDIKGEGVLADGLNSHKTLQKSQSSASNLSERIDLAWTGSGQIAYDPSQCGMEALSATPTSLKDDPAYQKVIAPIRIKSFDSAVSSRNRLVPDDPNASIRRSYSQRPPKSIERIGRAQSPTFTNKLSLSDTLNWEGRLVLPHITSDVVVPIYDDEPSSMIAHAMTVPEYHNFLLRHLDQHTESSILNCAAYNSTAKCSDGSLQSYGSDQPMTGNGSKDIHLTFDAIRRKCCPDELDYIRSLSRCKRWSAQGGKSNVYFAKTLDDRFVIKQVTRTELDSFDDYAAEYFKYLTESVSSGSPTCLTKILGLYQVIAKNLRDGKELKIDVMVMENLFFKRKVSRIYDLKGSLRSRYNPDTSGNNKVLLDLNLLETLHTKPIFLGSKAKRRLERAVWNDTSFLASVDVMDYSLLVGIDEERKELVMGIIDYLRQYTWDKQLETWVKASGFLGGSKDVLPTIISPDQYKKRFRKAMSKYFLTLPDQWSP
ncbi:hypothetical protein PR202_gb17284 [Eleusine coracana subsp. coracana]|uniref:1-phosphatidylinositol-3-phosphate 5-kinase n=1 Tax=Eleusine coracana subsp. coracana TaxID=191504 RepID=A0AAV5F2J5_ELECO|nr:hypothetical protein PR202_gb17284 [Eleusine coracana subsp. coracana]